MYVRWDNVAAVMLFIGGTIMFVIYHDCVLAALACIGQIPPGHPPEKQWLGVVVFGLLCFTLACIVKLLAKRHDRDGD